MTFEGALLRESSGTHWAHEPLVVVMYPHVLPQRLLPLVGLVADVAGVYALPVMLDHVHLQRVPRIEGLIAFSAFVVSLVEVISSDMTR